MQRAVLALAVMHLVQLLMAVTTLASVPAIGQMNHWWREAFGKAYDYVALPIDDKVSTVRVYRRAVALMSAGR